MDFGLTTTNALEAHLNKMMIRSAQETIAVMDASKFGRRGLSLICDLKDVDTVITDSRISDKTVQRLEEEEITVVIV
jgi:DeoR family transcriptional regulator of aga operon